MQMYWSVNRIDQCAARINRTRWWGRGGVKLGGERNGQERRTQDDTVSESPDPVLLPRGRLSKSRSHYWPGQGSLRHHGDLRLKKESERPSLDAGERDDLVPYGMSEKILQVECVCLYVYLWVCKLWTQKWIPPKILTFTLWERKKAELPGGLSLSTCGLICMI